MAYGDDEMARIRQRDDFNRIERLSEDIKRLQADLDLLARAGCRVREGKDGHRFVEITTDVV